MGGWDSYRRVGWLLVATVGLSALVVAHVGHAAVQPVDREAAIAAARAYVSQESYYEPAEVGAFATSASTETVGTRLFWMVSFRDTEGVERDRVAVSARTGSIVTDPSTLQALGLWDLYLARVGVITSWAWAVVALVIGAGCAFGAFWWMRRPRAGVLAWVVGGLLWTLIAFFGFGVFASLDIGDARGAIVCAVCAAAIAGGMVFGVRRRGRWALVEIPSDTASEPARGADAAPTASRPAAAARPVGPGRAGSAGPGGELDLRVVAPEELPSFSDVGGMDAVKQQLKDTVGLLVSHGDLAGRYRLEWNGVLLYGPPGVGKTFIAKATAGEFGLNFIDVRVTDLVSQFMGESPKLVSLAFKTAMASRPCVLFFDEFDSVGQRRESAGTDIESRRIVNQLLRELESVRETPDLIVMASTNHKETLDEAVLRPGRFDRHISIGLPDEAARRQVFLAQLARRPVDDDVDVDELVVRTDGLSAADITAVVNGAALAALNRSVSAGQVGPGAGQPIGQALLVGALEELRAKVRPTVAFTTWDDLVLDSKTRDKLMELQRQIEQHEELRLLGVEPPRGVLLYGPPGTGKTTIARVLASQSDASFFAVDASEIVSMWVGETEKHIARLFEEARKHRPSIIFIDEIDSLAPARTGEGSWANDVTSQFLREIDGVSSARGVFVIGATNVPSALDPALLRGGRLSRQLLIPLPDADSRRRLFEVYAKGMPVDDDVDLAALAARTDKLSGADIREICQAAGMASFQRAGASVTSHDFDGALTAYRADRRTFSVPEWVSDWDEAPEKRKGPLGFAPPTPREDDGSGPKEE